MNCCILCNTAYGSIFKLYWRRSTGTSALSATHIDCLDTTCQPCTAKPIVNITPSRVVCYLSIENGFFRPANCNQVYNRGIWCQQEYCLIPLGGELYGIQYAFVEEQVAPHALYDSFLTKHAEIHSFCLYLCNTVPITTFRPYLFHIKY